MTLQRKTKEFLSSAVEANAQGRFGIGRAKRNYSLTHEVKTIRLMTAGEPAEDEPGNEGYGFSVGHSVR